MKILYLLNRVQKGQIKDTQQKGNHDNHLYGMFRLRKFNIETSYLELEQYLPTRLASWIRNYVLNIYWAHAPLFFQMLKYDVVFTSTAFGAQLVHALYPFKKPKWVMLDFNITGFLGDRKSIKQKIFSFLVRRSDGIITIDKHERDELIRHFLDKKNKIEYIQFGVDTDFFKPNPDIVEENIIFSPGRDPGRDFKTLVEAIKDLNISAIITTRSWNIKKIKPLPSYILHKDLPLKEFMQTYASAKIIVLPLNTVDNVNNAMGCSTLVEAMAMGKAIIATRTRTTESYIIDGVNGILVPPRDVQALEVAISDLLKDKIKREELGKKARAFAKEHCSAEIFASNLASYFKKINI